MVHSGQTTGHARDSSASTSLPVTFPFHHTNNFHGQTSATRAISVLSTIILPLQTFFSRVLLLRQQAFSFENLPLERLTTTTTAIITQVFMFRYEHANSTRKFTIVAEIFSLLKKIYKRCGSLRVVFKVKTLAVLFPPYPREMKTTTTKFKSSATLALACFCGNSATNSHARSIARAWLKHAHSFDRCGAQRSRFLVLTKRSAVSGDESDCLWCISIHSIAHSLYRARVA